MGPSADDLRTFLADDTFPAERVGLIGAAVEAGAPDSLVSDLRDLPGDHLFGSVVEVASALRPSAQEQID
jgi:Protein of unknown function (DUF2795)